jgi:hypothetical protein
MSYCVLCVCLRILMSTILLCFVCIFTYIDVHHLIVFCVYVYVYWCPASYCVLCVCLHILMSSILLCFVCMFTYNDVQHLIVFCVYVYVY